MPDKETQLLDEVSGAKLMEATRAIAGWRRYSGEADELESFRWIEARLSAFGYDTQLIHHRAYISIPGEATLRIEGTGETIHGIAHAFAASTPEGGTKAHLVDGATGPADASGAVVLLDGLAAGSTALAWEKLGSVGQVHIHDEHLHESSVSPIWGNPTDETMVMMPRTPSLSVRRGDGERLRRLLSEGRVTVTIHVDVSTEWRPIPLLTASIGPQAPAPFVLLSTHVDSWHFGAMDNGSANATALEVARILASNATQRNRGLKVAFWSGHSHGRFAGSAWYADENWIELHDHCAAHVFVDSTGGKGATVVSEAPVMPQTTQLAARVIEDLTGDPFEGKRIGRFADQSFYGIGINCVFGTLSEQDAEKSPSPISFRTGGRRAGGLGWWWHTTEDTLDKIDEDLLVRDTKIYLLTVHRLLEMQHLPFDYRPAIREIANTIAPAAAAAERHLDLSSLVHELDRAVDAIDRFHEALEQTQGDGNGDAEHCLMMLARHLVPVAFHEQGRFGRDRAEPLKAVPALHELARLAQMSTDDPSAHALATRLQRAANWILVEIRAARRLAEQTRTRVLGPATA